MNPAPAIDWLNAHFEDGLQRYQRKLRHGALDRQWHGPAAVKPMIQLRSELDRCPSMRVTQADYHDPDRRWL
jgi:hypothetical protein